MSFTPRIYQQEAIEAGVSFFKSKRVENAIIVLPTGSGKSICIANIAKELEGRTLVFQPSKEILEQNYSKFVSYGFRAGIYSASAGHKFTDHITFATIGSVIKKKHLFNDVKHIIMDECDLMDAQGGMYLEFINSIEDCKVLGLTATPYRLHSNSFGTELRFITRTRPKVFKKMLYVVQNEVLFNAGFLAPLKYFSFDVIKRDMLSMNSNGSNFTDASVQAYSRSINMPKLTIEYAIRILAKRKNLLVVCGTISDADKVAAGIPGAVALHGNVDDKERPKIIAKFKAGTISCLVVCGMLRVGFDYPALEAVLLAFSTMSLRIMYQVIGRVMRPFTYPDGTKKEGWVVDLGGNIKFFGKIETMQIMVNEKGLHSVWNNGRQLTNVSFQKQ